MSWGSLLVELKAEGGGRGAEGRSFCLQKMRGKVSFSISLKYHSFNTCVTRGSTGLDLGFWFSRNAEGLKWPYTSNGREKEKNPLERRK